MKIGMCMFLWTTHLTRDHVPLLRDIKATGFDGVEVPVFEGDPAYFAELGALLDELGLERTAVSAMGDPAMNLISADAAERQAGIAHMKWALECAAALGADRLSGPLHSTLGHFSGEGPSRDEWARAVETQRAIGAFAAANGVTIGLEALNRFECYLVNTMDDLSRLIDDVGHPNIRAMYDTFHANIEEKDPLGAIDTVFASGKLNHVHISENDRGTPGRGHIDIPAAIRRLKGLGYDGWMTIEAFGSALPDLAAATRVWRDFFPSPDQVYLEGIQLIRQSWADA